MTIRERILALPRPRGTAADVAAKLGVSVDAVRQAARRGRPIRLAAAPVGGARPGAGAPRRDDARRDSIRVYLVPERRAQVDQRAAAASTSASAWIAALVDRELDRPLDRPADPG